MFAVLLGGAAALMPIYAREILRTGPWGLGLLRSAPGVGAALMAIVVAYRPIQRRAGLTMLWCVAGFGVFTILFGISRSLVVSREVAEIAAGAPGCDCRRCLTDRFHRRAHRAATLSASRPD